MQAVTPHTSASLATQRPIRGLLLALFVSQGSLWRAAVGFVLGGTLLLTGCGGSGDGSSATIYGAPETNVPSIPPGTPVPSGVQPSATAVGVPAGSIVSASIGAAGGSMGALDGKLVLTVPAGALASTTVISIQPLSNLAHGRRGAAYRLTPEGQNFLKPVTLTFAYSGQDLQGTAAEALGAAFQTPTGFWQWAGIATVDTTAKTVSVSSIHFSDWSMVSGAQLFPASKTIKVKTNVAMQVLVCYAPGEEGGLTPLGYRCETDGDTSNISIARDWSVNGRLGGGAFGTVSGNGSAAIYTAPQFEPRPNTVAVSASVDRGARGTVLLVSNITVVDEAAAYQIVGGLDDFQVNQAVCDITNPFTLSGGGFTAQFSGGNTGTYTYTGPFNARGDGRYSITPPSGPGQTGSMTGTGSGSVDTPLGRFENSGTETYTLTPLTQCP